MSLSPDQQTIFDHATAGKSVEDIATIMGKPDGIIRAQLTRIKNKGLKINGRSPDEVPGMVPSEYGQSSMAAATPTATSTSSAPRESSYRSTPSLDRSANEEIVHGAAAAGPMMTPQEAIETARQQLGAHADVVKVEPALLMGCAIQFMKLCGGRIHAHQVIEDVYGSIRIFADSNNLDAGKITGETEKFEPMRVDVDPKRAKIRELTAELGELLGVDPNQAAESEDSESDVLSHSGG